MQRTGKVIWFDKKKGYGFIKPDDGSKDIFVHYSNINEEGFKTLSPDQKVLFELGNNHKGEQCVNVMLNE